GAAHAEDRPINVVHGDERRRHAGGRLEELAAAHPLVLRELVAQLLDARLDSLLLRGLGRRRGLVAGDELRRGRRREGCGLGRQPLHGGLLFVGVTPHFIGEKAVGRSIVLATCCTMGPFFSLSANTRARSGSLANVSNLATRSSRLSQARR